MALSLVLMRGLLTTGEISGINASPSQKASFRLHPSAPLCIHDGVHRAHHLWNDLEHGADHIPESGRKPACSRSSTRAAGFVVSTNMAKARSMFKMLSPIREA